MTKIVFKRKLYGIAGAFVMLAFPYYVMLTNNNAQLIEAQSLCPFKLLSGLPCPGCGITKSMVFFYQGNLTESFHQHLFGPAAVLFCIATILILSLELITKKQYFQKLIYNSKLAFFLGATLAVFHLTRLIFFISNNNFDEILRQSIWK